MSTVRRRRDPVDWGLVAAWIASGVFALVVWAGVVWMLRWVITGA